MAVNLKTATPDTTLPAAGFLFGADSQSASAPSVYPLSALAQTLLGATAFSGDTVTASKPLLDLVQTWNNAAVGFTALKINAVNTASATPSYVFDAQISGSSVFSIREDGLIMSSVGGGLTFNSSGGYTSIGVSNSGLVVPSVLGIGGSSVLLNSDAANILGLRNGTNAQRFNITSSWTDASNLSRAFIDAGQTTANTLLFGSEHLGTGGNALTKFQLNVDGSNKLDFGVTNTGSWTLTCSLFTAPSGNCGLNVGTVFAAGYLSGRVSMYSGAVLGWGSAPSTSIDGAVDTSFRRVGPGIIKVTDGSGPGNGGGVIVTVPFTVASLPSAATAGPGARASVTDATQTLAAGIGAVVAGGGANPVPVVSNGTNWLIG